MKVYQAMFSGVFVLVVAAVFLQGCGGSSVSPATTSAARVSSVIPADGADSIPTDSAITVQFTGQMHMQSVQDNFHVHQGMSATGTEIMGSYSWNDMRTMMTFTPNNPMAGNATHTIHIETGMMGQNGSMMMNMSGQAMTQDMYMYFHTD